MEMKKDYALAVSFVLTSATNDELTSLYEAIVQRRKALARQARVVFAVGNKVMFSSRGVDYSGTIEKIKVKKAAVRVPLMNGKTVNYLVPLNMLKTY
jgi:hypothetical protein